jgi:outer membrane protein OmpA-like peptidoglycan-associated protein
MTLRNMAQQNLERTMKRKLIGLIMFSLAASPSWTAQANSHKEESAGVGGGAAIGAIAGGPIGLVLGAALGGWVGDKMGRERRSRQDFEDRFRQASTDLESLERLLSGSERELAALQADIGVQQSRFRAAIEDAFEAEVFFHTGESILDQRSTERLARLGSVMRLIDGFAIVVEGHADGRGNEEYNAQLSAERAAAVRRALIEGGLAAGRITSRAAGERDSTAAENDLDSLALERRVALDIVYPQNRVAQQ